MLKSIALCLFAATACSHRTPAASPKIAAAAPIKADASLLNDVDVRLLTEALAYDLTHSPWLQGLQSVQGAQGNQPNVILGILPTQVPPSDVPFPQAAFADSLVQSLRNTHRVDMVTAAAGAPRPIGPVWQLDVTVSHDHMAVEGEMSRGYQLTAALRLHPGNTTAWEKSYTLRKRVLPEAHHGDTQPST